MYIVQRVSKENYILKVNISKISKAVKAGFWGGGGGMFRCLNSSIHASMSAHTDPQCLVQDYPRVRGDELHC